jgi:hypothetical protein
MAGAAHDMTPADFVEWVRARGGFSRASEIGRAEDGRPLFLLAGEGAESAGVGEDDSP